MGLPHYPFIFIDNDLGERRKKMKLTRENLLTIVNEQIRNEDTPMVDTIDFCGRVLTLVQTKVEITKSKTKVFEVKFEDDVTIIRRVSGRQKTYGDVMPQEFKDFLGDYLEKVKDIPYNEESGLDPFRIAVLIGIDINYADENKYQNDGCITITTGTDPRDKKELKKINEQLLRAIDYKRGVN